MIKFAKEVLKFLEETFQDAYTYQIEYDPCIIWEDCIKLYVSNKYFKIKINSREMHTLYLMYKNKNEVWKEELIGLINI